MPTTNTQASSLSESSSASLAVPERHILLLSVSSCEVALCRQMISLIAVSAGSVLDDYVACPCSFSRLVVECSVGPLSSTIVDIPLIFSFMGHITRQQKNYLTTLADGLSDEEFSEVLNATSGAQKQSYRRGRRGPQHQTKAQQIASLNSTVASEAISVLKDPVFMESIRFLAEHQQSDSASHRKRGSGEKRNNNTQNGSRGSQRGAQRRQRNHVGKSGNSSSKGSSGAKKKPKNVEEHVPFSSADRERLNLAGLEKWVEEHNEKAARVRAQRREHEENL